jgi:WD40 repeat protein
MGLPRLVTPPKNLNPASNGLHSNPLSSTMRIQKITTIAAHSDRIWQCAPHPTRPLLATASGDKTSQIISLQTYTTLCTIDGGHKRSIRSVAWKPNTLGETVLATGSFDATCGIWRRYEDNLGITAGGGGGAEGYNDEEDEEWRFAVVLDGHESEIKSVAWSAGGSFLATCSRDKSVWVWEELDEDNFETIAVLQDHTQDVKCVAWHPEEALLASSSYDDSIRLYREDLDDWVCCTLLKDHDSTVWCVVFEPLEARGYEQARGSRLASCSDDKTVRIWTRVGQSGAAIGTGGAMPSIIRGAPVEEEWTCSAVLPKAHERSIYSISWSARSGRIVSCGGDGKIVVYEEHLKSADAEAMNGETSAEGNKGPWKIVAEFEGTHGVYEVNNVQWSKRFDKDKKGNDDEIILSVGDDGEVNIWELVE